MKHNILTTIILALIFITGSNTYGQTPTIGLIYSDENATEGYMLFSPGKNTSVYLVNSCGEKINEWTFSEKPGATCYLLEDGTLLRAGKDSLEIRDWNNNQLWSYSTTDNGLNQHHDIEPLPNGNILLVVRDNYTADQMIAEGKDTTIVQALTELDRIVEIQPVGTNDAIIVWEWAFIDHFIQDFDITKNNYGVINDHPELIDINYEAEDIIDWTHVNAIDYNANLDQILICPRNINEIVIIDHSTTTEEASGHTGGNFNRGGDLLWRWGNTEIYRKGEVHPQKLFLVHNPEWVKDGYTDEGKITVFNNGGDGTETFSSIHIITPTIVGNEYLMSNDIFLPNDFEWSWSGEILGDTVYERIKSGVHSLPNGNLIMCESGLGRVSELTKSGDHLWTYINPHGAEVWDQYEEFQFGDNNMFRGEKYPVDYLGFSGQDVSPKGIIENENFVSDSCIATVGIEDFTAERINIVNPVVNNRIDFNKYVEFKTVSITDISGKLIFRQENFKGNSLPLYLKPSIYIIQLHSDKKVDVRKIIVR